MLNTFEWYLCPYDIMNTTVGLTRIPAIYRYISTIPNVDNSIWDEAETLGNFLIVKVFTLPAVHILIQADRDFFIIPVTINVSLQSLVRNKLISLGFTIEEINSTGFDRMQLLNLLTSVWTVYQRNITNDGLDILPGRRTAGKTVIDIEKRLPG